MIREIVKINEELCNGCGVCIPSCKEGAIQIIDGKARLISDLLCDGLGACIGECPQGAITVEKRESEPYNEQKVMQIMIEKGKNTVIAHLKHLLDHKEIDYYTQALDYLYANKDNLPFDLDQLIDDLENTEVKQIDNHQCVCPSAQTKVFAANHTPINNNFNIKSQLTHWPVQLHLINPNSSFFKNCDLLFASDCSAFTYANFHQKLLKDKKLVIACPKLDDGLEFYVEKIRILIEQSKVNTITVVVMEVPCCSGLAQIVNKAKHLANSKVPVKLIVLGVEGDILQEEWL